MVKSIIHATPKEKKRDKMSNRYKLKFIEIMAPLNASTQRAPFFVTNPRNDENVQNLQRKQSLVQQ